MFKKIIKRIKHNRIIFYITTSVTHLLIKIIFATYRIRTKNELDKSSLHEGVFYTWHKNIIASAAFLLKNKIFPHCVVSPSRDGKFVGAMTKKVGFKVLYGSSHKEPIALVRNAINVLKKEKQIFLIGDGSRGPAMKLQPGIDYLSRKTNLPKIFIECDVKHKIVLKKSWDKFEVPLPFSKIFITVRPEGLSSTR
jgi:lysophospholipid acyltransferase (LPLAT)-like uncharacterized protein